MPEVLLAAERLDVRFPVTLGLAIAHQVGTIKAVDGVDLQLTRGETLGLVGESGCGKSTIGRAILQLVRPTGGHVPFDGQDVGALTPAELRALRRRIQLVFQDPYASLNPRMSAGETLAEPVRLHRLRRGETEVRRRVQKLLALVGLSPSHAGRFPHECSGCQRQRIFTARALASEQDLIVCDEPVSALDVPIQAQVVNLLQDLPEQIGLTYLFISHGLNVIKHIAGRVAVMYLGKIVETAPKERLYADPRYPYTRALLSAVPVPDPAIERARQRIILEGDVPSPMDPPPGCRFASRCPIVEPACSTALPALETLADPAHLEACRRCDAVDDLLPLLRSDSRRKPT